MAVEPQSVIYRKRLEVGVHPDVDGYRGETYRRRKVQCLIKITILPHLN